MADLSALREKILQIVEAAPDDDAAYLQAADLLRGASLESLKPLKLAILRTYTIEPLIEPLQVKAFLEGYHLELFLSEFNQIAQEILVQESKLHRFDPQLIFLAVRPEEVSLEMLSGWLEEMDRRSGASVLVSNFIVPEKDPAAAEKIRSINSEMARLAARFPRAALFDLEGLASRIEKTRFLDPVQMARMSNPYRLNVYPAYAESLMSHLRALRGQHRKCLVLDLDNTLWEGILGEDGREGVRPFGDFQQSLLELSRKGILLAINSKNNPDEALQMLRSHPSMVLKEKDFSAVRINWNDKADNLREIARELNIGLDALVFADDNPAECERVRQSCPEVLVVQLPADRKYRAAIESLNCFQQSALTDEDRNRTAMYQAQTERKKLSEGSGSLEDFYASLKMKGTLWRNNRSQITRIAQMTQKTNQFNLTTRRCTEMEIGQLMDRGFVYSLQVEDRFGDNGIIATAIVVPSPDGKEWVIDNLLMSCRVVMRTIEDSLLAEISDDAKSAGAKRLTGRYIPTEKNKMVKELYPQRGFKTEPGQTSAGTDYRLELTGKETLKSSPWVLLIREAELPR